VFAFLSAFLRFLFLLIAVRLIGRFLASLLRPALERGPAGARTASAR
jgi:hypothetical protein